MDGTKKTINCVVACCLVPLAFAQDSQPAKDAANQDVQSRLTATEQALNELKAKQEQQQAASNEDIESLEKRLADLQMLASDSKPGQRRFVVTGFAFGGFTAAQGSPSNFHAGFNPIFLWSPVERVLVEAQAEFELEDSETVTKLEYVQLSYLLNDYMTIGVGKFLNPANYWKERLHPAWINKLPDEPIAFEQDPILGESQLGAQLHGGFPVGYSKMEYSVFVSNGATLVTDDPAAFGTLNFDNYTDTHTAKDVGGRVGFFLLSDLEIGYAIEYAGNVTPDGSGLPNARSLIQCVDANFTRSMMAGRVDLRSQWAFTDVGKVTFDPSGSMGFGPATLPTTRNGGYAQAAYRPTEAENSFLNKLEGIVRFDAINLPTGAPEGVDESRWTFGLDYWTAASSVFKLAFELDHRRDAPDSNAILFQWAVGM
jgi:hypothetical protein